MWQEIGIYVIAIVVLLYVGRKVWKMVRGKRKKGCSCGCPKHCLEMKR